MIIDNIVPLSSNICIYLRLFKDKLKVIHNLSVTIKYNTRVLLQFVNNNVNITFNQLDLIVFIIRVVVDSVPHLEMWRPWAQLRWWPRFSITCV